MADDRRLWRETLDATARCIDVDAGDLGLAAVVSITASAASCSTWIQRDH